MIKFKQYQFKKTYLNQRIFELDSQEVKVGYLNINGFNEAGHSHYFDSDKNLVDLDIIVLAETKLTNQVQIDGILSNWTIVGRYDSRDSRPHMGLLLLKSNKSSLSGELKLRYEVAKRNGAIQIEYLSVTLNSDLKFGFIYSRSSPNNTEIEALQEKIDDCQYVLGDFNLSHRLKSDKEKLSNICKPSKCNILNEITRSVSNNQLDYVLANKSLADKSYSTSFMNFISDHNSITVRVPLQQNKFSKMFEMKLNFDSESHLKPKVSHGSDESICTRLSESSSEEIRSHDTSSNLIDTDSEESCSVNDSSNADDVNSVVSSDNTILFHRKFKNVDKRTCWLNSCLQLILNALDFKNLSGDQFTSMYIYCNASICLYMPEIL